MIGSTDIGDLGSIMPVIQPTMGGFNGAAHSKDFEIADEEAAYMIPAKVMAMTVVDLLWDGAAEAENVKKGYNPPFTKESYLSLWEEQLKI